MNKKQMNQQIITVFETMPFNQLLGLKVTELSAQHASLTMAWQDKLVGNPYQKILHGGVISTLLDTVGGLLAAASVIDKLPAEQLAQAPQRLSTLGTIDIRTDYLRPAKGEQFIASAKLIRSGNKVCVCRMELHNEENTQIAYGTGTYLVG